MRFNSKDNNSHDATRLYNITMCFIVYVVLIERRLVAEMKHQGAEKRHFSSEVKHKSEVVRCRLVLSFAFKHIPLLLHLRSLLSSLPPSFLLLPPELLTHRYPSINCRQSINSPGVCVCSTCIYVST